MPLAEQQTRVLEAGPVFPDRLVIGWWNTSLSPPTKPGRASSAERSLAAAVAHHLIDLLGADCLALGEVTREDIETLRAGCHKKARLRIVCHPKSDRFPAILYDEDTLVLADHHFVSTENAGQRYKIATRAQFCIASTGETLHILASHWPSRLRYGQGHLQRPLIGADLTAEVRRICSCGAEDAKIVLLGDYNDEPFDGSLAEALNATRDRELATKKCDLFYNPFWRHLGETHPHIPGVESPSEIGTYYYRNDPKTRWRTFDQLLFSSSLLRGSGWQLNESATGVVRLPELNGLITSRESVFDHLPVLGTIEIHRQKESSHG